MSRRHGTAKTLERPQERLTARPNEIMTRRPLVAASEQMRPGFEGPKGPKPSRWFWDAMPDTREINSNTPNLVGLRAGRMTCVGLAPQKKGKNCAAWLVRCDCGMYETRKAKALRDPVNSWSMCCNSCGYSFHLKRVAFHTAKGRWPTDAEEKRMFE